MLSWKTEREEEERKRGERGRERRTGWFSARQVPKSCEQDQNAEPSVASSTSPKRRDRALGLPASERKRHPLPKSGTGRFRCCPLWPLDKNVHLQIPSYPKSIWCVLRIRNKCAYPLSQALTGFHKHSRSQGDAQTCPKEGAPGGRRRAHTEWHLCPSPHPKRQNESARGP